MTCPHAPIPDAPDPRSICPLTGALDLIGDKWTLVLIRDMLVFGKTRYSEFLNSPESIPTNILADRLKRMCKWGLIEATPYRRKPLRYEYRLTEAGRALGPVMDALAQWGLEHLDHTRMPTPDEIEAFKKKAPAR